MSDKWIDSIANHAVSCPMLQLGVAWLTLFSFLGGTGFENGTGFETFVHL